MPRHFLEGPVSNSLLPKWQAMNLADITLSAVDGPFGSNLKTEHYVDQPGIRVVRLQNIGQGCFENDDRAYISEKHAEALKRYWVESGDLIIASLGDENHPIARACVYPPGEKHGIVKADCFRFRLDPSKADHEYVMHVLNCPWTRTDIARVAQGVTRDRVNLTNVQKIRLSVPPLDEQVRISQIISVIEKVVQSSERLIAKLKATKAGLLHDLLTQGIDENGELRDPEAHPEQFKESPAGRIPVPWEVMELSLCVERDAPICYGILMPGEHTQGGVPVIKVKDIVDGRILDKDLLLTHPSIEASYRRARLREGDVLLTIRGTTGRVAVVPPQLQGANITQDTARIRLKRDHTSHYFYFALQSREVQDQILLHTLGQAVKGINIAEVKRLKVKVPHKGEQEVLAERLSEMDSAIHHLDSELAKLKLLKRGLTEDLLTGRVRVVSDNG